MCVRATTNTAIKCFVTWHDNFRGKLFTGTHLSGVTERRSQSCIPNKIFGGTSHCIGVVKWHEQSGNFILNNFRNSANVCRDARAGKTHRFEDAQTKAFGFGCEQSHVRSLQIIFNLRDIFPHNHAVFKSQPAYGFNKRGKTSARKNHEFERFARADARHGFEQANQSVSPDEDLRNVKSSLHPANPVRGGLLRANVVARAVQKNCG